MNARTLSYLALGALAPAACTTPAAPRDAAPVDAPEPTDRGALAPYVDPFACPSAPARRPLDEPLDAAEARAGVITDPGELIGGEGASGRVGHLKIYNQLVRFVIQSRVADTAASRAIGYNLYGGNLIDADRVRPRGEPGHDLFRETFGVFAYRIGTADSVEVVCDGSNGRPAAIRVMGRDAATRILGSLDSLARNRNARVITHYILRPGSAALELRTEVASQSLDPINSAATGDFLGFGSALSLFTEATGFGNVSRASMPLRWLAGAGDPGEGDRRVSYAIGPAEGTMSVPVVDASGTIGLYRTVDVGAASSAVFSRFFSVGTGDIASAVGPLLAAQGLRHGTVRGTSSPGALVYAYTDRYAVGAAARMMARAGADGRFELPLSAGNYALVAVDRGRARGAPVSVTVRDGETQEANPMAGATATLALDLAVLGEGDVRVRAPMKVSLRGLDVEAPDEGLGDLEGESESYGLHRAIFSLGGTERVAVKPGRYEAIVSRGDRYEVARRTVTLSPNEVTTLAADLRRSVDTGGWVAADFHQHTVGSIDSGRGLCARVLENVAEGLEYAATTDHDNVTSFAPCITSLGLGAWFNATQGNEVSVIGLGHFNMYPLAIDPADPTALVGAQFWADRTAQQLFDRVRALPSDPVLHISHPRSSSFKGYFTTLALDPVTLETSRGLATGFEAIEVNDMVGDPAEYLAANVEALRARGRRDAANVPAMHDWFALLRRGDHTCALGNSDTHGRNGASGYPHNLVRVGPGPLAALSEARVRQAIRDQTVTVSSGISLRVRVNGEERMGWREVLRPGADGALDLDVEVQAPGWVSARSLVVFENGRPMSLTLAAEGRYEAREATAPGDPFVLALGDNAPGASGARRFRAVVRVRPRRDSFYVVLARGGELTPVGAGNAIAYTNPLYVDLDGNGYTP